MAASLAKWPGSLPLSVKQSSATDDDEQNEHDCEQPASDDEQPMHVRSDKGELLLTSQLNNAGSGPGHRPAGASGRSDGDTVTCESRPLGSSSWPVQAVTTSTRAALPMSRASRRGWSPTCPVAQCSSRNSN